MGNTHHHMQRLAFLVLLLGVSVQSAERIPGGIPELRRTQRLQPNRGGTLDELSGFSSISDGWNRADGLRAHPTGKLRVARPLNQQELSTTGQNALDVGTIVHVWQGHTYGVISPGGVAVSLEPDETPFFEVPATALETLSSDEHEALKSFRDKREPSEELRSEL